MIHRIKTVEAKELTAFLTGQTISEVHCVCKNAEKKPESVTLILSNGKEFIVKPGFYGASEYHITDEPKTVERFAVDSPIGAEVRINAMFPDVTKATAFATTQRDLGYPVTITKCQLPEDELPEATTTPIADPQDVPF